MTIRRDQLDDSRTRLTMLWTEAQPTTMAFIRSMVSNPTDAEDVLQQTAYDIASHFDEYDPDRPFIAWVVGIAKYKVFEYRRKQHADPHVFNDAALECIAEAYVEKASELSENSNALEHCMQKLNGKARKLVELRYTHNLKPAAIAKQIGSNANSVSATLSRVREALRACIRRYLSRRGEA